MAKFARTFELSNDQQVLLTLNYNDEDDNYEIEQRTDYLGMVMKIKLGFDTQERAEEVLDVYTIEDANSFIKTVKDLAR